MEGEKALTLEGVGDYCNMCGGVGGEVVEQEEGEEEVGVAVCGVVVGEEKGAVRGGDEGEVVVCGGEALWVKGVSEGLGRAKGGRGSADGLLFMRT